MPLSHARTAYLRIGRFRGPPEGMRMSGPLKPLREQINDLLSLHSGERRGFLLMMLLLVLLSIWVVFEQWVIRPKQPDLGPLMDEMRSWAAERHAASVPDTSFAEPFPFDPNTISRGEWIALGFTTRQVDGIERYMSKGGRFRVKGDVAKLYSLRPGQYERLESFILLPDSLSRTPRYDRMARGSPGDRETKAERVVRPRADRPAWRKVEVNAADSAELVALPGIGPSFARGILRYRDMLGGFVSLDQLGEVYVLKDKPDALDRVRELLVVDSLSVRRIAINTCTVEELAEHPYARWKLAKPLIAYRQQHGPFREVADIRGCHLIDEDAFRKLAPYLSVE